MSANEVVKKAQNIMAQHQDFLEYLQDFVNSQANIVASQNETIKFYKAKMEDLQKKLAEYEPPNQYLKRANMLIHIRRCEYVLLRK